MHKTVHVRSLKISGTTLHAPHVKCRRTLFVTLAWVSVILIVLHYITIRGIVIISVAMYTHDSFNACSIALDTRDDVLIGIIMTNANQKSAY